jgi:UDP-glucose 4-epimerase
VKLVYENPIHTIAVNVKGTENVLNSSLQYAKRVLVVSTSEVYGKDVNSRLKRFQEANDLSLGTSLRWAYGCSKALDEYLAIAYHRRMGLPVVISRIFNTVGPRQTGAYGMVIPRLIAQALRGQPLTVYGDGQQTRSFIWVKDTVQGLVGLMENPAAEGEIFNIGSEEEVTINHLAEKIKAKTRSSSAIVHIPYAQVYGIDFDDIRYRVPDITKIRNLLGFKPSLNIDQILDQVIASQKGK